MLMVTHQSLYFMTHPAPRRNPPFPRKTYAEIARRLGVHRSLVSRVAAGKATSGRVLAALHAEARRLEAARSKAA